MLLRQKYQEVVSKLVTPGALGAAVLLGSAASAAASQEAVATPASGLQNDRVSERLAAIRDAVSAVAGASSQAADVAAERQLAWGNWGWGRPWGNWGWGGPWNNWNNWRNGWHNWRNGWGNW